MIIHWIKSHLSRPRQIPQNILEVSLHVPKTVYIVAGGPNGRKYYRRIPTDGYTIAVNKSVLIPDIHPDLWILNSMNRSARLWIRKAHRSFHGVRVFKQNRTDRLPTYILKEKYFIYIPNQSGRKTNPGRILPHILRGGGTVSAYAIQIAAHLGAQNIVLCGVDMSGQSYWDGQTGTHKKHGEIWAHTDAADRIIVDLKKEYGLKITSLSPTKLNIKQCGPPPEPS